ncbi:hypothetical protein [Pseudomonas viridiflava]|uniref:hypothetical protein n=1 Tax=Pseudomonas viridiflava TaxID=33069 RepID=UPI000F033F7B|nr:hypothetical protein [Pseudomonas viridiflava]QXG46909.1 hypothetical protein KTT57_25625 [Pseudomonas viridiflava]
MSLNHDSVLCGNNLVSFGDGIGADLRQDILDCLLYAQFRADDETSVQRNWRGWLETYRGSVDDAGAQRTAIIADSTFMIRRLRDLRHEPFLNGFPSAELRELFSYSFDTLMNSGQARAFFNSWFSSGRTESIQVVPCVMGDDGKVSIMLCGLQMTTMTFRRGFFPWDVLNGEMRVDCAGAAYRFSRELFDPARSRVRDELASRAREAVIQL